jgi:HPt (histidine-containing phosphotransfer) domain-containing protein
MGAGLGFYHQSNSFHRSSLRVENAFKICVQQVILSEKIHVSLVSLSAPLPASIVPSEPKLDPSIALPTPNGLSPQEPVPSAPAPHPHVDDLKIVFDQLARNTTLLEKGEGDETEPLPLNVRGNAISKLTEMQGKLQEEISPLLKSPIEITTEDFIALVRRADEQRQKIQREWESFQERALQEKKELEEHFQLFNLLSLASFFLSGLLALGTFLIVVKPSSDRADQTLADLHASQSAHHKTATALDQYKLETELIFKTIRQGLFLMNREFQIGRNHTEELTSIFESRELAGMTLTGILQRILSEKMYRTCFDYVEMLFDPTKRERTLTKINPMDEIEVHFPDGAGGFRTKFLCFNFNRVVSGQNEIHQVFVSVRDVTQQIQLTKQLQASEKRKERQFLLLMGILHVKSEDLQKFTEQTILEIESINAEMKAENLSGVILGIAQDAMLRQRMNGVFRKIHAIKGNATYLGLDYFVHITNEIEDRINELKNTPRLSGEDFLGLVLQISELKNALHEIEDLKLRLLSLREAKLGHPAVESSTSLEEGLQNLCKTLSRQTEKSAQMDLRGFHSGEIPQHRHEIIQQTLIQFIRNSFSHGIESAEDRIAKQKDPVASISITGNYDSAKRLYKLGYRDDGKGFDTDLIRRSCLNHGFLTLQEVQSATDEQIIPYIFKPQVTTTPEADQLSGRGVGLDLVYHQIVNELGGHIQTSHLKDSFCEFHVTIPC